LPPARQGTKFQAALPHVDRFLTGNSLASLEELATLMEGGEL
jgi:uncharacterized protein with von Willebrand factor type A (vWA) domain